MKTTQCYKLHPIPQSWCSWLLMLFFQGLKAHKLTKYCWKKRKIIIRGMEGFFSVTTNYKSSNISCYSSCPNWLTTVNPPKGPGPKINSSLSSPISEICDCNWIKACKMKKKKNPFSHTRQNHSIFWLPNKIINFKEYITPLCFTDVPLGTNDCSWKNLSYEILLTGFLNKQNTLPN